MCANNITVLFHYFIRLRNLNFLNKNNRCTEAILHEICKHVKFLICSGTKFPLHKINRYPQWGSHERKGDTLHLPSWYLVAIVGLPKLLSKPFRIPILLSDSTWLHPIVRYDHGEPSFKPRKILSTDVIYYIYPCVYVCVFWSWLCPGHFARRLLLKYQFTFVVYLHVLYKCPPCYIISRHILQFPFPWASNTSAPIRC